MKKGILGGAFDPPHLGHLQIAEVVLKKMQLDEIVFIPTNIPPHKQKSHASGKQRLDMLELITKKNPAFSINPIELEKDAPSYSIETVKALLKNEPKSRFYFIIGADMIDYLPNWYQIDQLIQLIDFVGVKRTAYNGVSKYPIQMVDMPLIDISSSMIRERVKHGLPVDQYLPKEVWTYIKEHQLYEVSTSD